MFPAAAWVDHFRKYLHSTLEVAVFEVRADTDLAIIPVPQSTKTKLPINLTTANVLGITVPTIVLGRADEIIE